MSETPPYPSAPDPQQPEGSVPPPPPSYGGYGTPPPPPPGGGYGAPPGGPYAGPPAYDVIEAVKYGWRAFTGNVGAFLLLGLLAFLLPFVISLGGEVLRSGGFALAEEAGTDSGIGMAAMGTGGVLGFAINLISQAVALFFTAATVRAAFDVTEGRKADLAAAFTRWDKVQVLILAILTAVGTSIGLLLCVLPGIAFLFFTWFATYFVVGNAQGAIDAIKSSFRFTADHIGSLILLFLVSMVIAVLGACACGVGLLVALPVVTVAAAYSFRVLQGQPVAQL